MLEFVERTVFGVQQAAVPGKEVVADRLMHVVPPTAARSLRAGTQDDTATV
jgi:hypothetical protein